MVDEISPRPAQNNVVDAAESQAHVHSIEESFNFVKEAKEMRTASPAGGNMAGEKSAGLAAVIAAGFPDTTITNNQVRDLVQRNANRTTSSALEALSGMQPASVAELINDNAAQSKKFTPEQMRNWSDLKNTSVNFNNAIQDMHPKLQAAYNELPGNKGGTISHEQLKFLKEHSPEAYLLGTKYNQIHEKVFKEITDKQQPSKKDLMKAEDGVDKAVAGMKEAHQEEFRALPSNPKDGSYTQEQLKFLKDHSKEGYAAAQDYNRILNRLMNNVGKVQQGGKLNRSDIPQGERPAPREERDLPSSGERIYPAETVPAPGPTLRGGKLYR